MSARSIEASDAAKRRWSTLGLLVESSNALMAKDIIQAKLHEHCDIEFTTEECKITPNRLTQARKMVVARRTSCELSSVEKRDLIREQNCIKSLLVSGLLFIEDEEIINEEEEEEDLETQLQQQRNQGLSRNCLSPLGPTPPPQDKGERSFSEKLQIDNIKAQLIKLKLRSRFDKSNDGVLGVQSEGDARCSLTTLPQTYRRCSIRSNIGRGSVIDEQFVKYNMSMIDHHGIIEEILEEVDEEKEIMDLECVDYVRKPDMATIIEQYDAMANHPKYS
jgi:hypothetical protein